MIKGYNEQGYVEAGLYFESPSGLMVRTTGKSEPMYGKSDGLYRHEVEIMDGAKKGEKMMVALSTYIPIIPIRQPPKE